MYKKDLALNNPELLICHKPKQRKKVVVVDWNTRWHFTTASIQMKIGLVSESPDNLTK